MFNCLWISNNNNNKKKTNKLLVYFPSKDFHVTVQKYLFPLPQCLLDKGKLMSKYVL